MKREYFPSFDEINREKLKYYLKSINDRSCDSLKWELEDKKLAQLRHILISQLLDYK
jgi:hypothetical protein